MRQNHFMVLRSYNDQNRPSDRPDEGQDSTLNSRLQTALGAALQAHYNDLAAESVPDRFLVLLAELEAKEDRKDN